MEGVKIYEDFFFTNINKKTNPEIIMNFYNRWKRYEASLSSANKLKAQDFSNTLDKFVNRMKDYSKKSQQKSLEKLRKLPELHVNKNDTNIDEIEDEIANEIVDEIPINSTPISQNCPPVGTKGFVKPVEEGWIFVYTDYTDYYTENEENKGLLIKPTDDKKLEVFSQNDVYNKSQNSSCSLYIRYLDNNNAILVDINEALSYPNINYPEPAVGWGEWAINTITTGITYASYIGVIAYLMHVIYTIYIYNSYHTYEALNEFLRKQVEKDPNFNINAIRAYVYTSINKLVETGRITSKHAPGLLKQILTYLSSWNYNKNSFNFYPVY